MINKISMINKKYYGESIYHLGTILNGVIERTIEIMVNEVTDISLGDDDLGFVRKAHHACANGYCLRGRNCNPLLPHYHIYTTVVFCM